MPAALRKSARFYPAIVARKPSYAISAHANYRRDDFMFPRVQSREMRDAAWAERAKPLRSWSEIAGAGALVAFASIALMLSATLV